MDTGKPVTRPLSSVSGILLAAGRGRRFGGDKLLHPLPDGTAVGIASWRNLRNALTDVIVVVREDDAALRRLFETQGASVMVCQDADLGLSRSLIRGIRARQTSSAWLIALGDMPYVQAATYASLIASLDSGAKIVVPEVDGQRGNPVGFSHHHHDELLALQGDEGARSIIKRHADSCVLVPTTDRGILLDIDTPADLA